MFKDTAETARDELRKLSVEALEQRLVELRSHARRHEGRFFGRRVNCEQVPLLPAWAVAQVFDDPREIPYLLVWKDSAGTVWECVYIAPHDSDVPIVANELRLWAERDVETGEVEITRADGTTTD